jgi:hypothetical protein
MNFIGAWPTECPVSGVGTPKDTDFLFFREGNKRAIAQIESGKWLPPTSAAAKMNRKPSRSLTQMIRGSTKDSAAMPTALS